MPSYSAEGAKTYREACALVNALRESVEYNDDLIYANITGGGVSITVAPQMVKVAEAICKDHGFSFKAGYTAHQEDVMMCSKRGYDALEKVTNNAHAVYKEWS